MKYIHIPFGLASSFQSVFRFKNIHRDFSMLGSFPRAKVLVVGSGRMGKIRAGIVRANPKFELAGVVDTNMNQAASLSAMFGGDAFPNIKDAVQQTKGIDGVIVSTPTFTHGDIIREAADHGLNIFTEKPVDQTADKIEKLFDYCIERKVKLCCGFQRRFDPSYVAATEAVKTGKIGTPIMANIFFADHPVPPREFLLTGGNIFMDLLAHDCDFICHALDDSVVSVYAKGTSSDKELATADVHDNATVVLTMKRGTIVSVFMSRSACYGYDQRCEIFGTKGLVSVRNVHEHSTVISTNEGIHSSKLQHSFPERFREAFEKELNAFAETVLRNKEWPVTAKQCIDVQRIADAAAQSASSAELISMKP